MDPSIFYSDNEPTGDSFTPYLNHLPTEDYDVHGKYIRAHNVHNKSDDDTSIVLSVTLHIYILYIHTYIWYISHGRISSNWYQVKNHHIWVISVPVGPLILNINGHHLVPNRRRAPVLHLAYNFFKYFSIWYYLTTGYGPATRFLKHSFLTSCVTDLPTTLRSRPGVCILGVWSIILYTRSQHGWQPADLNHLDPI